MISKAGSIISLLGILCMGYGTYSVNHEYGKIVTSLQDSLSINRVMEPVQETITPVTPPVIIKTDTAGVKKLQKQIKELNAKSDKDKKDRDDLQQKLEECRKEKTPNRDIKTDSTVYWKNLYILCREKNCPDLLYEKEKFRITVDRLKAELKKCRENKILKKPRDEIIK